ncbi:MAG: hypothetical protein JWQ38_1247 [Flavipsychrobacter sp.]|nr:hypothetical protein [Flavipsychrobacter sp.]
MKIEEVIKIYEFLGNLTLVAFLGVYILLMVALLALLFSLKDKIVSKTQPKDYFNNLISGTTAVVTLSLCILYYQAQKKMNLSKIALHIKSEFVYSNFTQKSFRNIDLPGNNDSAAKLEMVTELINTFPNEFTSVRMPPGNSHDTLDITGIAIIDPVSVDQIYKTIEKKAIFASYLITKLIKKDSLEILYTDDINHPYSIQENIDKDGWFVGRDFFQYIIGKDSLFPVYNNQKIIGFTTFYKNEAAKKRYEAAYEIIFKEFKKRPNGIIGFKALRDSTKQNYSDDFLKQAINNSNEQLYFIKLENTGNNDTLGIKLPNSSIRKPKNNPLYAILNAIEKTVKTFIEQIKENVLV